MEERELGNTPSRFPRSRNWESSENWWSTPRLSRRSMENCCLCSIPTWGWDPSHLGAVLRSNVSLLHLSRLSAHAYVRGVLSSDWNTLVRARSVLRFGKES